MITKSIKISGALSYINIAITVIIGIYITPRLIQSMGQAEYGLYSLAAGTIMLMAAFDFGLSGTVTRFVAKYKAENDSKKLQETINSVQFIFSILYVFILASGLTFTFINKNETIFSLSQADSEKALLLLLVLLPSIPATMQTAIYTALCNGYEKFIFPRALQLTRHILRTAIILSIIKTSSESVALVIIDLALSTISLIAISIYSKKRIGIQPELTIPEYVFLMSLGKYSFWIFIWSASMQFFWQIGQISVASSVGVSAVTTYAICIMLGTYYGAFVGAYATMFMPTATRHVRSSTSPEELGAACVTIGRVNSGILLFILGGFFSTGELFIDVWLSDTFDKKNMTTIWQGSILVMIGYTIPLTQSFFNQLLEANGLVRYKSIICLLLLPTSAWAAKYYAVDYGVVGAISTMLACWLISQLITNIYYHRALRINIVNFFIKSYSPWITPLFSACLISYPIAYKTPASISGLASIASIYSFCFAATYLTIRSINPEIKKALA